MGENRGFRKLPMPHVVFGGANMTARQQSTFELDNLTRTRLMLAGQIAAGMCGNKENYTTPHWQASIARSSLEIADKLIKLTVTGGV